MTWKARIYAAAAITGSALAGYGATMAASVIMGRPQSDDSLSPMIGCVVFVAVLYGMFMGIEAATRGADDR